ncbi:MAG: DNA alkylation repair protein [Clostridiaceae bacterium]
MELSELILLLKNHGNEENKKWMENYMRNQFSFLGIKTPERRELVKEYLKGLKVLSMEDIVTLYNKPEREYKYVAIGILTKFQKDLSIQDFDQIKELSLIDPWWDTIDSIGPLIYGPMALRDKEVKERLRGLIYEDSIWLRRISILFQLKYKDKMDEEFLAEAILSNADTREFFIDKAIGWVLREYSKTNPGFVREFIGRHKLSPLSVKEGSKYIDVVK